MSKANLEELAPQRPSVGRIVHYCATEQQVAQDRPFAAIVAEVHPKSQRQTCVLVVFPPELESYRVVAPESPSGRPVVGCWHWPLRT